MGLTGSAAAEGGLVEVEWAGSSVVFLPPYQRLSRTGTHAAHHQLWCINSLLITLLI